MFRHLQNHPFSVAADFDCSLVITYAVEKEELENKIPECLELDTYNNKWAFIAIALVKTSRLRPKGMPKFMGSDFHLIGFRVFVKYTNTMGKRLRGLYILKSETDKAKMAFFGNIFTHYKYTVTDISFIDSGDDIRIHSDKSQLNILVHQSQNDKTELPNSSPFNDWKSARRYAGPLPYTFTYDQKNNEIVIIEGVRTNWIPEPVQIINCSSLFVKELNLKSLALANGFVVRNVPYFWRKGKIEKWRG